MKGGAAIEIHCYITIVTEGSQTLRHSLLHHLFTLNVTIICKKNISG